jgi:peptide/nickel transport system substrate-binding protein
VAIPAAAVILAVTVVVVLAQGRTTPPGNVGNHPPGATDAPASSNGPAPSVAGAVKGGTITVLEPHDLVHLVHIDPARTYLNTDEMVDGLITRGLTGYQEIPRKDGSLRSTLVGDLATDTGVDVHGDCRVWQYTLKSGLKYEDGTDVTPADVAYGVARTFSPNFPDGPKYLANWLTGNPSTSRDYGQTYQGPYNGGEAKPPNVTFSSSTITFTFAHPECDMPYVAALPITAPVPRAHDTGGYDQHPSSTGPYKVAIHTASALTLVRNPQWDPNLDPIREANPDEITFALDVDHIAINRRLAADAPADQAALTWENVTPADSIPAASLARAVSGPTQFVDDLTINNARVTDVSVRRALNLGLDKISVLNSVGGNLAGTVLNTIDPPTMVGWRDHDMFGAGASGDPAKARAELHGRTPRLTLCYDDDSPVNLAMAQAEQTSLQAAGFVISLHPIDHAAYIGQIRARPNTCDLYRTQWGADYPSASSVIPPLLDGRILISGDFSGYDSATTDARIDRISAETDRDQAAADWAALDQQIMQTDAPLVPVYDFRAYSLVGSQVGGAFDSPAYGLVSLDHIYVKA